MANTLLTPVAITREALRILHNKVKFIGSIDRQHDNKIEFGGQKAGGVINIRKPPQFTVGTGRTITVQDAEETYTALTVNTQKNVAMAFAASDLTLSIDDFSKRFIAPAVSRLAAQMEADALTMYKDVYNEVGTSGTSPASTTVVLQAKQKLVENLVPEDSDLFFLQTPGCEATLVGALTGLYNDNATWGGQYSKGVMTAKEALGFKFLTSAQTPRHTNGGSTRADGTVNGDVANGTATVALASVGVSSTILKGDILTFTGVYAVDPETKTTRSSLQQFVVTTATTSDGSEAAAAVVLSPTPYFSGPKQNISTQITNGTVCTWSTAAAAVDDANLAYHPQAFTFATANLEMPRGVDMAAREEMDGLSIRLVRDWSVNDDLFITRLDCLYGYVAQRPEWACRILGA